MRSIFFLSIPAAHAASITQFVLPTATVTSASETLGKDGLELRRRQQDVSYLTQVSWSSFIGQFPWPDPSTGPTCKPDIILLSEAND